MSTKNNPKEQNMQTSKSKDELIEEFLKNEQILLGNGKRHPMFTRVRNKDIWVYLCYPCGATCLGEMFLQSHLKGKKHTFQILSKTSWPEHIVEKHPYLKKAPPVEDQQVSKNAVVIAPGEPKPPGVEEVVETTLVSVLEGKLNEHKNPLIGLEYIIEIIDNGYDPKPPSYFCVLCLIKGDPHSIFKHIDGFRHKMKYMNIHYPTCYRTLQQYHYKKEYYPGNLKVLENICGCIEQAYGKLKPTIITEEEFQKNLSKYVKEINEGRHFNEKDGGSFEELVDEDYMLMISKTTKDQVHEEDNCENASHLISDITIVQNKTMKDETVFPSVKSKKGAKRTYKRRGSLDSITTLSDVSDNDDLPKEKKSKMTELNVTDNIIKRNNEDTSDTLKYRKNFVNLNHIKKMHFTSEKERWDQYRIEVDKMYRNAQKDFEYYENNAEKHPFYEKLWLKFWEKKCLEFRSENKNIDMYELDLKPEWIKVWGIKLKELHEENLSEQKKAIRDVLNLPEDRNEIKLDRMSPRSEISVHVISSKESSPAKILSREKGPQLTLEKIEERLKELDRRRDNLNRNMRDSPIRDSRSRRQRSKSPRRRRSPSPRYHRSPRRLRSPSPRRQRSPSPRRLRSQSPRRLRSPSPRRLRSPMSRYYRSPSPRRLARRQQGSLSPRSKEKPYYSMPSPHKDSSFDVKSYSQCNEKMKWAIFHNKLDDYITKTGKILKNYLKDPESHPYYKREYLKHKENRYNDNNSFLSKSSWNKLWCSNLEKSRDNEIENKRNALMNDLGLTVNSMNTEKRSKRSNSPSIDYLSDTWNFDKKKEESPQTSSSPVSITTDLNLISVLRLLTALESYLDSLGPKVVDLLTTCLRLEKERPNSSETLLYNDEYCVTLETVKEKLKGLLLADLIEPHARPATKKAIQSVALIVHKASKLTSENKVLKTVENIDNSPINIDGIGTIEKSAIADQIARALIAQGKTDVTTQELEVLINAVVGRMTKTSNNNLMSSSGLMAELATMRGETVSVKMDMEKLSNNEASSSMKNQESSFADKLSDADIITLFHNYKDLSKDEQNGLIVYLRKLEVKEPVRTMRLRNNIDFNIFEEQTETKGTMRSLSPFSSRNCGSNPEDNTFISNIEYNASPMNKNKESDDDDDYNYDDIYKSAAEKVKEKQYEEEMKIITQSLQDSKNKIEKNPPQPPSTKTSIEIISNENFNAPSLADILNMVRNSNINFNNLPSVSISNNLSSSNFNPVSTSFLSGNNNIQKTIMSNATMVNPQMLNMNLTSTTPVPVPTAVPAPHLLHQQPSLNSNNSNTLMNNINTSAILANLNMSLSSNMLTSNLPLPVPNPMSNNLSNILTSQLNSNSNIPLKNVPNTMPNQFISNVSCSQNTVTTIQSTQPVQKPIASLLSLAVTPPRNIVTQTVSMNPNIAQNKNQLNTLSNISTQLPPNPLANQQLNRLLLPKFSNLGAGSSYSNDDGMQNFQNRNQAYPVPNNNFRNNSNWNNNQFYNNANNCDINARTDFQFSAGVGRGQNNPRGRGSNKNFPKSGRGGGPNRPENRPYY